MHAGSIFEATPFSLHSMIGGCFWKGKGGITLELGSAKCFSFEDTGLTRDPGRKLLCKVKPSIKVIK